MSFVVASRLGASPPTVSANISLSDLLANRGKYNMGHLLRDGDCYKERYRPYSPFLRTRIGGDYKVPKYFSPMSTFQIGIGTGPGIGNARLG